MKHITLIFATVLILFSFSACGEEPQPENNTFDSRIVGTWVLSDHYSDGYSEKDYLYVFHTDGTMDFYSGDVWTMKYANCKNSGSSFTMTIDDVGLSQEYSCLIDGNTMKLVSDSGTLKLIKISDSQTPTPEQLSLAY